MAVLERGHVIYEQLNHSVVYVGNPQKTTYVSDRRESIDILEKLQPYIDPEKTGQFLLKSAINCDSYETAYAEMQATKAKFRKQDKRLGYHFFQAFHPDEKVHPAQVHEIGRRLAEECWGGRFEVAIGTHMNEKHLHNHFIINSVSFADGLKYRDQMPFLEHFRDINDRICKEYGLSIIEATNELGEKVRPKRQWKNKDGLPVRNDLICVDIDACIRQSLSFEEFMARMKALGYSFPRYGPTIKRMSVLAPGKEKARRLDELPGEYSEADIRRRIAENTIEQALQARREAHEQRAEPLRLPKAAHIKLRSWRPRKKLTGLQARYYRILYTFGMIRRRPRGEGNRAMYFALYDQIRQFSSYVRQTQLLMANGIESYDDLKAYREGIQARITEVRKQRRSFYYQKSKGSIPEAEAAATLKDFADRLKDLRRTWHDCNAIEERSEATTQRIEAIRWQEIEQKQKSKSVHVHER